MLLPLSVLLGGGVFELADDEDWSELEALDDGVDDGDELDGVDEAIDEDDDGAPGELDDGVDCDMLDELGGVVDDVEVLWRSLHATVRSAAAIATDSTEAFICFSFLEKCDETKQGPGKRTPVVSSPYRPRVLHVIGTFPKGL